MQVVLKVAVLPAYAGMILRIINVRQNTPGAPRIRGDDPNYPAFESMA